VQVKQAPPRRRGLSNGQLVALICLVGLLLTALASWTAWRADRNTEERLLEGQTRRAASVLSAAIASVQQPLAAALDVQDAVRPPENGAAFEELFQRYVGPDSLYVSASLWRVTDGGYEQVTSMGAPAGLTGDPLTAVVDRAMASTTAVVARVTVDGRTRIAYALADRDIGYVVYAERPIPADRRAPVDRDSAYADLDYAIYLGDSLDTEDLTTTNRDPDDLPLTGNTFSTAVPFGDTELTLVTAPSTHLGNDLSRLLPWMLLAAGVLVTALTATSALRIVRARQQVDTMFTEQRNLFVRLQKALLPQVNPRVPGFEFSSEYVAAGRGMDVGGDWYSAIATGEHTFAFVVGDVSGHGIDAVAEMARARFTLRAYLVEGDSPRTALEKCASQFDADVDGHIITVLAGIGDRRTGRVVMASAGHPAPALVNADTTQRAAFVDVPTGPPLGVGASTYGETELELLDGSSLVIFTDGLVERRTEPIDEGLARLLGAVDEAAGRSPSDMVASILETMDAQNSGDDVALLVLRRDTTGHAGDEPGLLLSSSSGLAP
jgi:serine phosphatase RsbU (regulator of sigma subunit)